MSGPREKNITVRCEICDDPVETTRQDTKYCSPRCRQRASRLVRKWGKRFDKGRELQYLDEQPERMERLQREWGGWNPPVSK